MRVRSGGMKGFVVEWMEDIWGNVWEKNGMNLRENWVQKTYKVYKTELKNRGGNESKKWWNERICCGMDEGWRTYGARYWKKLE
jgi:hypothetical protein